MAYTDRQSKFLSAVGTLPAYQGVSPDFILSNMQEVLNSGDNERINKFTSALSTLGPYQGTTPDFVLSNVKEVLGGAPEVPKAPAEAPPSDYMREQLENRPSAHMAAQWDAAKQKQAPAPEPIEEGGPPLVDVKSTLTPEQSAEVLSKGVLGTPAIKKPPITDVQRETIEAYKKWEKDFAEGKLQQITPEQSAEVLSKGVLGTPAIKKPPITDVQRETIEAYKKWEKDFAEGKLQQITPEQSAEVLSKGPIKPKPRVQDTDASKYYQPGGAVVPFDELVLTNNDSQSAALFLYGAPPEKQRELLSRMDEKQAQDVLMNFERMRQERTGPAFAASVLKGTPLWMALPNSAQKDIDRLLRDQPEANITGSVVGGLLSMYMAGPLLTTQLIKIPALAKMAHLGKPTKLMTAAEKADRLKFLSVQRGILSSGTSFARSSDKILSGTPEEATQGWKNVLNSLALSQISPAIETYVPHGLVQIPLQVSADVIGQGILDRLLQGKNVLSKEYWESPDNQVEFWINVATSTVASLSEAKAEKPRRVDWAQALSNLSDAEKAKKLTPEDRETLRAWSKNVVYGKPEDQYDLPPHLKAIVGGDYKVAAKLSRGIVPGESAIPPTQKPTPTPTPEAQQPAGPPKQITGEVQQPPAPAPAPVAPAPAVPAKAPQTETIVAIRQQYGDEKPSVPVVMRDYGIRKQQEAADLIAQAYPAQPEIQVPPPDAQVPPPDAQVTSASEELADMSKIGYMERGPYRADLDAAFQEKQSGAVDNIAHASVDMMNLTVLNKVVGHDGANDIMMELGGVFKDTIDKNAPEGAIIRYGRPGSGDEFAVTARNMDKEGLDALTLLGQNAVADVVNSKEITGIDGKKVKLSSLLHPKNDFLKTGAGYFSVGVSDLNEAGTIAEMVKRSDARSEDDAQRFLKKAAEKESVDSSTNYLYNSDTGYLVNESSVIGRIIGEKLASGEWQNTDYEMLRRRAINEINSGGIYERYGKTGRDAGRIEGGEGAGEEVRSEPSVRAEPATREVAETPTQKVTPAPKVKQTRQKAKSEDSSRRAQAVRFQYELLQDFKKRLAERLQARKGLSSLQASRLAQKEINDLRAGNKLDPVTDRFLDGYADEYNVDPAARKVFENFEAILRGPDMVGKNIEYDEVANWIRDAHADKKNLNKEIEELNASDTPAEIDGEEMQRFDMEQQGLDYDVEEAKIKAEKENLPPIVVQGKEINVGDRISTTDGDFGVLMWNSKKHSAVKIKLDNGGIKVVGMKKIVPPKGPELDEGGILRDESGNELFEPSAGYGDLRPDQQKIAIENDVSIIRKELTALRKKLAEVKINSREVMSGGKPTRIDTINRQGIQRKIDALERELNPGVFEPSAEYGQQDLFGAPAKTQKQLDAEEKKRLDRAEMKTRQEARKGGEAPIGNLPMFQDQDIEGSQMTLLEKGAGYGPQPEDKNLVALHNIEESSLAAADKSGGLAVPSIGITKKNQAYPGYGRITLIADKEMIDPTKPYNPVFTSDVYSATVPRPTYRTNKKAAGAFMRDVEKLSYEYGSGYGGEAQRYIKYGDRRSFEREAKRDEWMRLAFLKENGVEVEKTMRSANYASEWTDLADTEPVKRFFEKNPDFGLQVINDKSTALQLAAAIKKGLRVVHPEDYVRAAALDNLIGGDGKPYFGPADRLHSTWHNAKTGKMEFDRSGFRDRIENEIEKIGPDKYEAWVENKADEIFHSPYIDKKGKPEFNLENIVDAIVNAKTVGVQKNMTFGINQAKSFGSKMFKSIDDIRAARGKIKTHEEYEAAKDKVEKKFFAVTEPLRKYYEYARPGEMSFEALDDAARALANYYRGGKTTANMLRALSKNGYKEVPEHIAEEFQKVAQELIDSPVVYFEAKPQRAVKIEEFSGAVIPADLDQRTRDILDRRGIKTVEYDGSIEDRQKKVQNFAEEEGLVFEPSAGYGAESPRFYSPTLRTIETDVKQEKGVADQIKGMLRKGRFKKAETDWLGLEQWLDENPKATKTEVLDFVRANQVELEETVKGSGERRDLTARRRPDEVFVYDVVDEDGVVVRSGLSQSGADSYIDRQWDGQGETKYSEYTLPGAVEGSDRELLLRMPNTSAERLNARRMEIESLGRAATSEQKQEWADIMNRLKPETRDIEGVSRFRGMPDYKSSHWDEPNVVAHTRVNDRVGPDGEKVLFVEEIQSDWAREAREKGIRKTEENEAAVASKILDLEAERALLVDKKFKDETLSKEEYNKIVQRQAEVNDEIARIEQRGRVPNQPFLKNWNELLLKRILRMAAEEGYDRVAWINGAQTADRYDLSKQVDRVAWTKESDGTITFSVSKDRQPFGFPDSTSHISKEKVAEYLGKDVADKIDGEVGKEWSGGGVTQGTLSGLDLKIGGEWAVNLYDKQIPNFLNKFGKKFGAQVEDVKLRGVLTEGGAGKKVDMPLPGTQMSIPVTDAMRESVMSEGMPLFEPGAKYKPVDKPRDIGYTDEAELNLHQGSMGAVHETIDAIQTDLFAIAGQADRVGGRGTVPGTGTSGRDALRRPDSNVRMAGDEAGRAAGTSQAIRGKTGRVRTMPGVGRAGESTVPVEWGNYKRISFEGHIVPTPREVAEMISINRHPHQEFTHLIYLHANTGEVVRNNVMTAGVSNASVAKDTNDPANPTRWKRRMEARLKRLRAKYGDDIVALLGHNHPGGDNAPSAADIKATKEYAQIDGFEGHVIIDGDRFTFIDKTGKPTEHLYTPKKTYDMPKVTTLRGARAVAELTKSLIDSKNRTAVMVISNSGYVMGWHPIKDVKALHAQNIHQLIQESGGLVAIIATNDPAAFEVGKRLYEKGYRTNMLDTVLLDKGNVIHNLRKSDPGYMKGSRKLRLGGGYVWETPADYGEVLKSVGGEDQTDTPAFKKWFGDSKVVDESGKPLVVYHGTGKAFAEFKDMPEDGRTVRFGKNLFYFTRSKKLAEGYSETFNDWPYEETLGTTIPQGANIMPVYLSIKNPYVLDAQNHGFSAQKYAIEQAAKNNNDGVILKNVRDIPSSKYQSVGAQDVYIVTDPTQIKSATGNAGTFDPDDANIIREPTAGYGEEKPKGRIERTTGVKKPYSFISGEYEAKELEQETRRLRGKMLALKSREAAQARGQVSLAFSEADKLKAEVAKLKNKEQIAQAEKETVEALQRFIMEYAREAHYRGPVTATAIRRTKTAAGLKARLDAIDRAVERAAKSDEVKRTRATMDTFGKRIEGWESGKRPATIDRENVRALKEYIEKFRKEKSGRMSIPAIKAKTDAERNVDERRLLTIHEVMQADQGGDQIENLSMEDRIFFANAMRPPLEQMSSRELREVRNDIVNLYKHGKTTKVREMERQAKIDDTRAKSSAAQIEATFKKPPEEKSQVAKMLEASDEVKGLRSKIEELSKLAKWGVVRPELMSEYFTDNYQMLGMRPGAITRYVFDRLNEATDVEAKGLDEHQKFIEREIVPAVDGNYHKKTIEFTSPKEDGIERESHITSPKVAMHVYAYSQNEQSLNHLYGTGLDDRAVQEIISGLTDEQREAVDKMIDYYDDRVYPRLADAFYSVYGVDLPKAFRYFPITNLDRKNATPEVLIDLMHRVFTSQPGTPERGFTKGRVLSALPFGRMDFLKTVVQHARKVEHYIAFEKTANDVNRFLRNPRVQKAMDDKSEAAARNYRQWVKEVASGRSGPGTQQGFVDALADWGRMNIGPYALFLNPRIWLVQPASIYLGIARSQNKALVPVKVTQYLTQKMANPFRDTPMVDFVNSKSPMMKKRGGAGGTEVSRIQNAYEQAVLSKTANAGLETVKHVGAQMIQEFDKATVYSLWVNQYEAVLAKTGNEKKAIASADMLIRRTQPMSGVLNLPEAFRNRGWVGAMTSFQNQVNQNMQQLLEIAMAAGAKKTDKGDLTKAAIGIMAALAAASLHVYALRNGMRLKKIKDEPESLVKEFITSSATGSIPVVNAVTDQVMSQAVNEIRAATGRDRLPIWGRNMVPAWVDPAMGIADAATAAMQIPGAISEGDDERVGKLTERVAVGALETGALAVGAPGGFPIRAGQRIAKGNVSKYGWRGALYPEGLLRGIDKIDANKAERTLEEQRKLPESQRDKAAVDEARSVITDAKQKKSAEKTIRALQKRRKELKRDGKPTTAIDNRIENLKQRLKDNGKD